MSWKRDLIFEKILNRKLKEELKFCIRRFRKALRNNRNLKGRYMFSCKAPYFEINALSPAIPAWNPEFIPIPPIISFTNWFDFISAIIEPINRILLNNDSEFSRMIEYGISSIIETTICNSKSENKLLNQLLKNDSVD